MRLYGTWAGNPKGTQEDPKRCIEEVYTGSHGHQCARSRGHGPRGLYCKQHDPIAIKAKEEAKYNKFKQKLEARRKDRRRGSILSDMATGIETDDLHKYVIVKVEN